jgi:multiple sugar transport system substrate-binding protein
MSNRYSRRAALKMGLGSLAGLSGLSLAACSTTTTTGTSSSPTGPVKLNMVFWGSDNRNTLTQNAIKAFHSSNDTITITSQYAAFNDYWSKVLDKAVAAGNTPDLIQMDMRYLSRYARQGLMKDLSQYIYDQTINLSDFDPLLVAGSKANNTLYGISMGGNYHCLLYDQGLLEQAGFPQVPERQTWQEFRDFTVAIGTALQGQGQKIFGTADASCEFATFENWYRQRADGKEVFTVDGALATKADEVAEWFDYWTDLRNNKGCVSAEIQKEYVAKSSAPAASPLALKQSVFEMAHTNEFQTFQKAALTTGADRVVNLAILPTGPKPGLFFKSSMLLSISNKSQYPKEAAQFINFLINDPAGIKAIGNDRGIPGARHALGIIRPTLKASQLKDSDFTDMMAKTGTDLVRIKLVLDPPSADKVVDLFRQIGLTVVLQQASSSDAAKEFIKQAKVILGK